MIGAADTSPSEVLPIFSSRGITVAFLSPTATGLSKAIIDATTPFRTVLKGAGLHDFDTQQLGPSAKIVVPAAFVRGDEVIPSVASLYRPKTKKGDPRVWFTGLPRYAAPGNLIAVIPWKGTLYLVNASDPRLLAGIEDSTTPLGDLASRISSSLSAAAVDLLHRLRGIAKQGFIRSVRAGDTGVGATLEEGLGIRTNNERTPDFKGIEIKASRQAPSRKRAKTRVNLFAQVPDWELSPIGSASRMVDECGYESKGRRQLYCSVDARGPNSLGLQLSVDSKEGFASIGRAVPMPAKTLLVWTMQELQGRLAEKHPESFWVKAEAKRIDGVEHFRYYEVTHTVRPAIASLAYLLADGTVSLDLTMRTKASGRVKDHGYLFKIWPKDLPKLFPEPRKHFL